MPRPLRGGELVAAPPDGEDAARLGRVVLDLGAQPVDVRVDGVLVTLVLVAPDLIQQVQPRIDLVGMAGEEMQQVELARRQVQRAPVQERGARHRIDGQAVQLQRAGVHAGVARQRVAAAQQRPYPRHQLQHREGLGQVVVGAQLQAQDAVHLAGTGAGDDDGRVARHAARALADLQAVHARQHQVQHQRVPAALFQPAHAFMTVGGMLDRVAFVAQVHAQQFGDVGVVLDDQHAAGGFHGGSGDGIALLSPIGAAELSHF